ncbi:hypothetical protein Bhyg_12922 [Pseudolycoriella hygida]|uniref:Uncharacterized protein n=1 Tax=Pseudolycoriella hygida TaxID=35572 RepID=A0A9Q0S1R3_9DIPT|nr:hypothetical protein Bhyg_12922 [Pseudolycoriella hygida]
METCEICPKPIAHLAPIVDKILSQFACNQLRHVDSNGIIVSYLCILWSKVLNIFINVTKNYGRYVRLDSEHFTLDMPTVYSYLNRVATLTIFTQEK